MCGAQISSFQDDLRRYEANVLILVDLRNRVLDSINSPDAARLDVQREELRRFTSNLARRMLALEEGEGGAVMDEKRTEVRCCVYPRSACGLVEGEV